MIVVGNLPYYITSPILLKLAENSDVLDRAVLMVQREVAERISGLRIGFFSEDAEVIAVR